MSNLGKGRKVNQDEWDAGNGDETSAKKARILGKKPGFAEDRGVKLRDSKLGLELMLAAGELFVAGVALP